MTQNINMQRQEGEAEQSPIQHQALCRGRGGREERGAIVPWLASISFLSSQLPGEQRGQALCPTAEAPSLPAA